MAQVAATVIDRVSSPQPRPVRYTRDCANRIRISEEALQAAIKAADTGALQAALSEAEEIGCSLTLLDEGAQALMRLQAQIELQAQLSQVEKFRPLQERAQLRPLLKPLKLARERQVQHDLLETAERFVQAVDAEINLRELTEQCATLTMEEDIENGAPSANSAYEQRAHPLTPLRSHYVQDYCLDRIRL